MNIDFSKFHKIECDDHSTVLQHPNGHQIKIAHKNLDPKHQAELDKIPMKMAKGGFAKYSQKYDPNMGAKASKASPASSGTGAPVPQAAYTPPKMAKDAYTEPDNGGTDIVLQALDRELPPFGPLHAEKPHYPPCINPSCKSYGRSHPNCRCYGGNPQGKPHGEMQGMFSKGGEVGGDYCSKNNPHQEGCQYFKAGGMAEGEEPVVVEDVPETQLPVAVDPVPVNPEPKIGPSPENQSEIEKEVNDLGSMADREVAAQTPKAPINPNPEMAQATTPEKPEAQAPAPIKSAEEHGAAVAQHLLNEDAAVKSDINAGHITPMTYQDIFNNKDTVGKIGTLFGMLVAGAGSGLSHQPNVLMQMMDTTIKNDMEAKVRNQANRANMIKLNQEAMATQAGVHLTEQQALQLGLANEYMAKNRAALDSLVQANNKLPEGSPQRQQGDQMLALLSQKIDMKNQSIAAQAGMAAAIASAANMGQGGGQNTMMMKSGLMGPEFKEMGHDIEEKTIPGVPGKAARPVQQHDRDQIQAMNVLSDKANDLMNYAKQHHGTLSPSQRKVAAQKAEEMVNFYNNSIQGGVLTEGRLKWLDEQISKNPTGVTTQLLGNQARLKEIKDSNDHRRNILLDSYGFPKSGGAKTEQTMASTVSKSGKPMIQKNGKWFYK